MIALSGVGLRETQGNSAFKQLANVSANQLLAVKGVGPITIAEIRDKLASCGIKLKGE